MRKVLLAQNLFSESTRKRLALVMQMTVAPDGSVRDSEVSRARVFNHAKLAYDSVAAWLDGTAPAPARVASVAGLDEQLRIQDRVAQAMRGLRQRQGALGLETREARVVFEGEVLADVRVWVRKVNDLPE